jgi:putative endonuclease
MFHVYVLLNTRGQLYIGFTSDLEKRLQRHNDGSSGWTHSRGPWQLVHMEKFEKRADALKREKQLKTGRANQDLRNKIKQ